MYRSRFIHFSEVWISRLGQALGQPSANWCVYFVLIKLAGNLNCSKMYEPRMKHVISRKKWTLAKSCIPYLPIYLWNYPRWQPCRSKRSSSRSLVIPKHDFWPCNPSWTSWWPLRVSCTFLRWRDKCQVSFGGTTAEFRWYPSLLRKTLCLILLIGKICEWNDNPIHLNVLWMFDFYVELGRFHQQF